MAGWARVYAAGVRGLGGDLCNEGRVISSSIKHPPDTIQAQIIFPSISFDGLACGEVEASVEVLS